MTKNNKKPLNLLRNRKRRSLFRFLSSSSPSAPPPPPPLDNSITTLSPHPPQKELEDDVLQRQGPGLQTRFKRLCKVASPYWLSDDKVGAWLHLASVFALTLATTGISVGFNFLSRDFSNALANKDQQHFTKQLMYYLAAFAGGILVVVLSDYAKETLALRWRSWMTSHYMDRYLKNKTFYKIQSQSIIDNPDQRIVNDISSFSNILLRIYPPLFVVLIVYSIGGTEISIILGRGLVNLNFLQKKKEADFRYGLVRVREYAESIAFYGGEKNEIQLLLQRCRSAFEYLSQLLISSRNLEFFTSGYSYLIQILPAAVVAPIQSASAFNHILGDFSLIVYQFEAISDFSAVIDRLGEFDDVLDGNSQSYSDSTQEISIAYSDAQDSSVLQYNGMVSDKRMLDVKNLKLETPKSKTTLIRNLSLEMNNKDHLLITGPSGCGKTSLLRAVAGLWSTGEGKITFYIRDEENPQMAPSADMVPAEMLTERYKGRRARGIFFLPQRPYMVLGTLRQQLLYPTWSESTNRPMESTKPTDDDLVQVLEDVRLDYVLSRFKGLDSTYEWSSVLSLGEQQRLAFARLLLSKPKLVMLDESTSALDEDNEAHLYKQIEAAGITYVSVGHRRTLYDFHCRVLHISKMDTGSDSDGSRRNWLLKPITNQDSSTGPVEPVS
ncbi:hypothetical protein MKX03_018706 [Papaver bracteatum]|nr:hypothetical protein MKX03_018706 [Papaver bracteatum]